MDKDLEKLFDKKRYKFKNKKNHVIIKDRMTSTVYSYPKKEVQ